MWMNPESVNRVKTGREKHHILTLIFYILYYIEKRYRGAYLQGKDKAADVENK